METGEGVEDQRAGAVLFPEVLLGLAVGFGGEAGIGERGEDVFHVRALDPVEVEVGGVEFRAELGPFGFLPDVNAVPARALEVASLSEGEHVLGGAGEF